MNEAEAEKALVIGRSPIGGDKVMSAEERESTAWCPSCCDGLETIRVYRNDKEYGQIIDHWEYYCFGCDKTFILTEKANASAGED